MLAPGGPLAIVGVLGTLVGLWRLGRRVERSVFQVAAVLLIVPCVSIVGQTPTLVGTRQALGGAT